MLTRQAGIRSKWARIITAAAAIILLAAALIAVAPGASAGAPFIEIVKSGPHSAYPGENIIFTLTLRTHSSGVATRVVVWDDLEYDAVDRFEIFRRELTDAALATLNNGEPVVIHVYYQVPCDAGGHTLDNDGYAEATFTDGTVSAAMNDHDVPISRPDVPDCAPAIDLEKYVNGHDADTSAEAVIVPEGGPLTFEYIVTNTGDAVLRNLTVVDDNETPDDPSDDFVVGTIANLAPGQSQTFTRHALAEAGLHTNLGEVCGTSSETSGSQYLCDEDPANYKTPPPEQPGAGTPGYWMNHPDAWPVDEITIGGVVYPKAEAIDIMKDPVKGDKTYTMFPALVAAKLNVLIGNDASCIAGTIAAADAWMAQYPVGSGVAGSSSAWKAGEPLYEYLDDYNNGLLCAPSRDDFE